MIRRVILESPYAGGILGVQSNIEYAKRCMMDCIARDEAPIASHLLWTQPGLLDDAVEGERALGIEAGLAWLKSAEALVVYTDLGISSGMNEAIARAEHWSVPVEYRSLKPEF